MALDKTMLAYCGIYCEQCSCRAAVEERDFKHLEWFPDRIKADRPNLSDYVCGGCKGACLCDPCGIKECASAKGIDSCAECDGFPCENLRKFAADGVPHHKWALDNLRNIRENGIESWFGSLTPAWRCHCGKRQSWYRLCPEHG